MRAVFRRRRRRIRRRSIPPPSAAQCCPLPKSVAEIGCPNFFVRNYLPSRLEKYPPFQKPRPSFTSLDRARRPNIKTCVSLENGPFNHRGSRDLGQVPYQSHPTVPCSSRVKCNTRGGEPRPKLMDETFGIFICEKKIPSRTRARLRRCQVGGPFGGRSRGRQHGSSEEKKTKEASMMRSEVRENDDADDDENERDDDNDDNILCVTSICLK